MTNHFTVSTEEADAPWAGDDSFKGQMQNHLQVSGSGQLGVIGQLFQMVCRVYGKGGRHSKDNRNNVEAAMKTDNSREQGWTGSAKIHLNTYWWVCPKDGFCFKTQTVHRWVYVTTESLWK